MELSVICRSDIPLEHIRNFAHWQTSTVSCLC